MDARNVLRSRWPNVPPERLLELVGEWAARLDGSAVVVFDGRAPAWTGDRVEVVGTGSGSADDWIAERVRAIDGPAWVVTSDRGLRARVGPYCERIIGGGAFLGPEFVGYDAAAGRRRRPA